MKKSIIDSIEFLGRRYGAHNVYGDFLQMAVCAFAHGTYEDEYFKRIKRYSKEELYEFPKILGEVIKLFDEELSENVWCDFLGDILQEIGLTNQKNGQFLTPKDICTVMAQFSGDMTNKSLLDPSVGTGRLLLAPLSCSEGIPRYVEGVDVDLNACNISAINLFFHGLSGRIVWGNSLSLDTWRVYEVNMGKIPIRVVEDPDYLKKQQEIIMNSDIKVPEIPHLFTGDLFA